MSVPDLSSSPLLWALVPCAGNGQRAGGQGPKQYRDIAGRPMVDHTIAALAGVRRLAGGLLVVGELPGHPVVGEVVAAGDHELVVR